MIMSSLVGEDDVISWSKGEHTTRPLYSLNSKNLLPNPAVGEVELGSHAHPAHFFLRIAPLIRRCRKRQARCCKHRMPTSWNCRCMISDRDNSCNSGRALSSSRMPSLVSFCQRSWVTNHRCRCRTHGFPFDGCERFNMLEEQPEENPFETVHGWSIAFVLSYGALLSLRLYTSLIIELTNFWFKKIKSKPTHVFPQSIFIFKIITILYFFYPIAYPTFAEVSVCLFV